MKNYSGYQFAIFRIIFGLYLFIHFLNLLPCAPELFSQLGVLSEATLSPTYKVFPSFFWISDSREMSYFVVSLGLLASLFIIFGKYRRIASLITWLVWAMLFNRNNFISNPSLAFVGWALLAFSIIKNNEPWALNKRVGEFVFPKVIFWGGWLILGLGYTVSGLHKAFSPSWQDGTAILHLANNPLSRDYFLNDLLRSLPIPLIKMKSWGILLLEIFFLPFIFFLKGQALIWVLMLFMHLGIVLLVDFADLTFGMIMFHLFLINPNWFITSNEKDQKPIVFFDGVCGLCNNFINFLFTVDIGNNFNVATLQGETSKKYLTKDLQENFSTIVVWDGERTRTHSDAVLFILGNCGGIWKFISLLTFIPRFFRDIVYKIVAKNRYQFFGKEPSCRIPTQSEREKFLT